MADLGNTKVFGDLALTGNLNITSPQAFLVHNGANVLEFTDDTYGLKLQQSIHSNNYHVNYLGQVHFNSGVSFLNSSNSQLEFKFDHASVGSMRFKNGDNATRGYVYHDSTGFGLLNSGGSWGLRTTTAETSLYQHSNERLRVTSTGGTTWGDWVYNGKIHKIGSSTDWDLVGSAYSSRIHFQGHDRFWIGAGNGTWFKGTQNVKATDGVAADMVSTHNLLITTMATSGTTHRGITFGAATNDTQTAGWRLGQWHSGAGHSQSLLVVDGTFFAKGGRTSNEYDFYTDDYSVYGPLGQPNWSGDGTENWNKPSIVSSTALQIQSGNKSNSADKPQLQFHQYGYGGIKIEYDGPNDVLNIGSQSTGRLDYVQIRTESGLLELGAMNTSHCHIQTDRSNFYFNKEIRVDSGIIGSYNEDLYLRRAGTTKLTLASSAATFVDAISAPSATFSSNTAISLSGTGTPRIQSTAANTKVGLEIMCNNANAADSGSYGTLWITRANTSNNALENGSNAYFRVKNSRGTFKEFAGIGGRRASDTAGTLVLYTYNRSEAATISESQMYVSRSIKSNSYIESGSSIRVPRTSAYNKLSVFGDGAVYAIGMVSGRTHGGLNDWAMTFQMNNETDRGFEWGAGNGAVTGMSLTTHGNLQVSSGISIGTSATWGSNGVFFSDVAGRTAFKDGDFYIQTSVGNYYNYATVQYHGNTSGDTHYFRGNPLYGNGWEIQPSGAANFNSHVNIGVYDDTTTGSLFLNGSTALKRAELKCTDGNLHLDANSGSSIYLNWYGGTGGTFFGNGSSSQSARIDGSGNYTSTNGNITLTNGTVEANNVTVNGANVYHANNVGAQMPVKASELPPEDLNTVTTAGFFYQTANADTTNNNYPSGHAGSLLVQKSAGVCTQMYITYDDADIYTRTNYTSWSGWRRFLNSGNYTEYTVTKTGSGASGTWGISISGNATTASSANWADKVDVNTSSSSSYYNTLWASGDTVYSSNGKVQIRPSDGHMKFGAGIQLTGGIINHTGTASYDKIRVWSSNLYTIGMNSAMTHGWLNDYAMTFTMNNETDRGFVWRHYDMAKSAAAMSLTTNGNLCVANVIGVRGSTAQYISRNGNYFRWQNGKGYVDIGCGNSSWNHFFTDRAGFYFSKKINAETELRVYNTNSYMNSAGVYGATLKATSALKYKNIERRVSTRDSLDIVLRIGRKGTAIGKFKDADKGTDTHRWFIADEVNEIIPEVVEKKDGEVESLNYNEMLPDAYAAIAEQQNMINELQRTNEKQQHEINELKLLVKQLMKGLN